MEKLKIMPPTILLGCIMLAVGLDSIWPLYRVLSFPASLLGTVFIGIGVWLNLWSDSLFRAKNTTVDPYEDSSELIVEGPFHLCRHPMYVGMSLLLLGIAVLLGSASAFLAPFVFAVIAQFYFIPMEEKKLIEIFGDKYRDYQKKVRGWL